MSIDFSALRGVISDLDGVLWRGSETLPHAPEFFAFLRAQGIGYALATNNSMNTVAAYVEKLAHAGIVAGRAQIITSAVATAQYIARHYAPGTPVYVVGEAGIREALAERGFPEDPAHAQIVVVGLDLDVTYEKLKRAALLIRAGADFIGTNGDRTFPLPEGLVPGNGSLLAAVQAATDRAPVLIGKPEAAMFDVAREVLGTQPEQTLALGDRLDTDILGGQRAGLPTALVLTGITTAGEARASSIRADGVFADLAALQAAWSAALNV